MRVLAGAMRGFTDQIGDTTKSCGELVLILCHPRAILDNTSHSPAVKGHRLFLLRHRADKPSVGPLGIGCTIHPRCELCLHLKQLLEDFVVGVQQVVKHRVANQHCFDVERHRFGSQGHCTHQAQLGAKLLNFERTVLQGALQPFPTERTQQTLACWDDEISAVSPMQGTRLNHGVICKEPTPRGLVFDPSNQIVVSGIGFHHNRRTFQILVVHQNVDFVTGEQPLGVCP